MFARALIIVGVSQRESLSARAILPCVSRMSDNPRQTEIIAFLKFLLMRLFCIFYTFQHNVAINRMAESAETLLAIRVQLVVVQHTFGR